VLRLARENPVWEYCTVHGGLCRLGHRTSAATVQRSCALRRKGNADVPRGPAFRSSDQSQNAAGVRFNSFIQAVVMDSLTSTRTWK
jgi:hypothetical protein